MSSTNEVETIPPVLPKKAKHKWSYCLEVRDGKGDLQFPFLDNRNYQDYCLLSGMMMHPFHLTQYGGKGKVLDECTKWCNEWVAPDGSYPLQRASFSTIQSRYRNVAETSAKMADKTGPPWGDVEEYDGSTHTIRQQIYDLSIQVVDDVTDQEKRRDVEKEAQKQKDAAEMGQMMTIRNACMKTISRQKNDTDEVDDTDGDDATNLLFLAKNSYKTPKKEKKDPSPTTTANRSFTDMVMAKEGMRDEDNKRKYDIAMQREERKKEENQQKLLIHHDKMKKIDEQNRLKEREMNLRHEQQMKLFEALWINLHEDEFRPTPKQVVK